MSRSQSDGRFAVIRERGKTTVIQISTVSVRVLLTGADTGGAFESLEFSAPPGSPGPQLHTHRTAAETFYVVEGALRITASGETTEVHAGGVAHVPPNVPHMFSYPGPGLTRFMVTITPAIGLPDYFAGLAGLIREKMPPDVPRIVELMQRFDSWPATKP